MAHTLKCALVAMTFLLLVKRDYAVSSVDVTGQWKQMSINGTSSMAGLNAAPATPPTGTPPCPFFSWTDRTLTLFQIPGHPNQLRGFWRKRVSMLWTMNYTQDCRWSNEPAFRLFNQVSIMLALSGTLDDRTGEVNLNSTFLSCDGVACDRLVSDAMRRNSDSSAFSMRLERNELVDPSDPGGEKLIFLRTGDAAERIADSENLVADIFRSVDKGSTTELAEMFGSTRLSADIGSLSSMIRRVGRLSTRSQIFAQFSTWSSIDPGNRGEYILVVNQAFTDRGLQGLEYLVLRKEGGIWKLDWMMYS